MRSQFNSNGTTNRTGLTYLWYSIGVVKGNLSIQNRSLEEVGEGTSKEERKDKTESHAVNYYLVVA